MIVPTGDKQLLVAGAVRAGAVSVVSRDADGEVAGRGPARGRGRPRRRARAAGRGGPGAGQHQRHRRRRDGAGRPATARPCFRLRPLQRSGLIADVRPGAALGTSSRRRRRGSEGRPAPASMPSSSATCSTTTVSTIASRSARVAQRCSMRPAEHDQPGRASRRCPRTSDDSGTGPGVPVVGELGRVLDGVLHQAEPVLPAFVELGDDVEHERVEALASAAGSAAGRRRDARVARPDRGAAASPRRAGESRVAAESVHEPRA